MIKVNMEKAKNIKLDALRVERNKKLSALDIEFQKALEQGDTEGQQAIAARKQALRDLPQTETFEGIETPEDLKGYIPEVLKD